MLADRHRLKKRLQGLKRRRDEGKPYDQGLARLRQEIQRSRELAMRRAETLPQPRFPPDLPISEKWQEIAALISENQVIILCGETGSGKSTQLPKICLALERGIFGRIGHTQPRRIAARSLAGRISEELECEVGTAVGYKVRFHDQVRPESQIKLMTDGMLLAEIQQDRFLNEYDTLIIDEAHERSLNIDFLLGYLKQLLPKRPDLKIIITSATIDPERFAEHFDDAPIINVSGRTYPVEIRYRPPHAVDADEEPDQAAGAAARESCSERDDSMQQAILDAVDELSRLGRGDILVFLSGEREIRETAESLRKHKLQLTEVLPLYARLGPAEQARIFHPTGQRRIILATNVAETSLTVPGIRYVIDAGFARISRYSFRSKVQRLPVERISQASADQRKGRCGRVAAGVCLRLYSEEDFESRREFTEPEILRTNLASVILQMKILGFGEIDDFPFVDPPDSRLIKDGYRVLEEIGAVAGDRRVSRLGRSLARLPVDPRIGRMLLEAAHTHCLNEALVIAAALSIQDPRERPLERQQAADEAHHPYRHEESDFLSYLKLWEHLEGQRRHLSKRKFRIYCRDNFFSWTRVQEWHDIHHQLRGQMHELGYKENRAEAGYEELHKAVLSGLLSHVGLKGSGKEREYQGARNSRFHIFPGSGLFQKQPKWVVAAELVETTRLYARGVAAVRPEWIESLAGHLVKRGYSEPHWEKNRGQVAAYERVNLFGLTLIARRKVNYGPINPQEAREIFIRSALVDGDFHTRAPFWRHNRELTEEIEEWENRNRRRDLLADQQTIYDYYDRRIPEGIYSTPQFEKWLRGITSEEPKILHMRMEDLVRREAVDLSTEQFPDRLDLNGMQLPLEYHFEPGRPADGVTLKVPQTVLNQVSEDRCQWLVPGLLRERIIALLRSLPKQLRKSFVPAPDFADACVKALVPTEKPLILALSEQLKAMTGVHVPEDAWGEETLADHLKMNFQVLDENGRTLDSGRDLARLQRRHGGKEDTAYHQLPVADMERDGIREWDFGELPEMVEMDRGGIKLRGFPALVDQGDAVALRVLDSKANAERVHRAGLRRLFMLKLSQDVRFLQRNLEGLERMRLQYAKAAPTPEGWERPAKSDLGNELIALIMDLTFIEGMEPVRNSTQFAARISERKGSLVTLSNEVAKQVGEILGQYQQLRKALAGATQINWVNSIADMKQQLDRLVFVGFLQHIPYAQLKQLPRYLKAITKRLEKLDHAAARDRKLMQEMAGLYNKWQEREEKYRQRGRRDERIEELRWMFEELRVSLFAQELKTAYPISLKRIEKRWRELGL
jgi:ATP-dependent helicase HrpA